MNHFLRIIWLYIEILKLLSRLASRDYFINCTTYNLWDEGGNTSDWNSTSMGRDAGGKIPTDSKDIVPNGIARQNVTGLDADGVPLPGYNPVLASFLKLREVALYFKVPSASLQKVFGNAIIAFT